MRQSTKLFLRPEGLEELKPPRSLATGALWVTGSRFLLVAASAGVSIITARVLGPVGTGRFALAVAFFGFLSSFATLGLDVGVTWQISRRHWQTARAFATTQRVAAVVGLVGSTVGFGAYTLTSGFGLGGPSSAAMVPVFLALPFALSWMFGSGVALASDRYELALGPQALHAGVYLVAVAALAPTLGLPGALAALLLGHSAAAGAVFLGGGALRSGGVGGSSREDLRHLAGAISFGASPYLATLLTMINFRIDLFLLAAFTGKAQVGYYALAVALTLPLSVIAGSIGIVLFPRMASLAGGQAAEDVESRTLRHVIVLILAGGTVTAAVLLLLVTAIYGARFAPVTEPGLILLPGAGALALFHVFSGALSGRGNPQAVLRALLLTTPVTVALYLILIPAYGINGAALASTVSYSSSAILLGLYLHRAGGGATFGRLIPGRDELADYVALVGRVRDLANRKR